MHTNRLPFLAAWTLLSCWAMAMSSDSDPRASVTADWPQWRGPNHNGEIVNSPRLLDTWPKEGPKLAWKADFIHAGETPNFTTDTGASSPVVAHGRVFLYADWARGYAITRKMLDDWGWMDGVPDELAQKLEKARTARDKETTGQPVEKRIADFLATLSPEDAQTYGALVRKRLTLGRETDEHGVQAASWESMAHIVGAGVVDKSFPTFEEWTQIKHNNKRIAQLLNGHSGPESGANAMREALLKQAKRADVVCCLDAATGTQLWRKEYPVVADKHSRYEFYWQGGASGTPAIGDGRIYVAGGAGLYCLSVEDGKELWKVGTTFTHSSPLVAQGMVYQIFGRVPAPNTSGKTRTADMKAFDARTGELRWTQENIGQTDGSPALWEHQGKSYLVIAAPGGLLCLDAGTGAQVWKEKSVNIYVGPHSGNSTPVVNGDIVLIQGMAAYRLTPQKAEVLWHEKQRRTGYGASGLIDKNVAYFSDGYSPFFCIDMATGKEIWKTESQPVPRCFAPILADGKIFLHDGKGTFLMLRASKEKFEQLGAFKPSISGKVELSYSISPALAGGRLYLRLKNNVVCYELTEAGNP